MRLVGEGSTSDIQVDPRDVIWDELLEEDACDQHAARAIGRISPKCGLRRKGEV